MTPMDQFKALWNSDGMTIPFVEVVNTQVDTDALADVWGSAMLQSEGRRDITMGSMPKVEESGTIIVGLFARSGTGRSGLDAAASALRAVFHGAFSGDDSVHFTAVVGPEDIDPEADGEWWRLGFTVPYTVNEIRPYYSLDFTLRQNSFYIPLI